MTTVNRHETDVVVVGGGGAALRAALEARRAGARVLVITKGRLGASGTTAFEVASLAGFAVPDGAGDPSDSPDVHFEDITRGDAPSYVTLLFISWLDGWQLDRTSGGEQ